MVIELESDNMLVFKVPSNIFVKYGFDEDGLSGVSLDEMLDMMNGSHSQISKRMGCSSKMVLMDDWIEWRNDGTIKMEMVYKDGIVIKTIKDWWD